MFSCVGTFLSFLGISMMVQARTWESQVDYSRYDRQEIATFARHYDVGNATCESSLEKLSMPLT